MNKVVYLCGPITTESYSWEWREEATVLLDYLFELKTLDPMRGKNLATISDGGLKSNIPGRVFMTRDLIDVQQSDLILCNFLSIPDRQCVGSLMELGYALALDVPFIVVTNDDFIRLHPFISENALYVFDNMEDAIDCCGFVLTGASVSFKKSFKDEPKPVRKVTRFKTITE